MWPRVCAALKPDLGPAAESPRDRNTVVDWDKLRRVLEDVVAGHPGYNATEAAWDAPHYSEPEE